MTIILVLLALLCVSGRSQEALQGQRPAGKEAALEACLGFTYRCGRLRIERESLEESRPQDPHKCKTHQLLGTLGLEAVRTPMNSASKLVGSQVLKHDFASSASDSSDSGFRRWELRVPKLKASKRCSLLKAPPPAAGGSNMESEQQGTAGSWAAACT